MMGSSGQMAYLWLVKSTQRLWDEAGLSLVLGHGPPRYLWVNSAGSFSCSGKANVINRV
jgi:hypothetical protein